MLILFSLALAFLASWYGGSVIRKKPGIFYAGAAILAAAGVGITWSGLDAGFPVWFDHMIWSMLSHGALATSFFIIVMWTGALPNGSAAIKRLMPIRAELSIIASIMILGHNIAYGRTYFVRLFTNIGKMDCTQVLAAICSLMMIAIILPLMITSFKSVRRKMKPKTWKKLQRCAYIFYALIYAHIMLLYVPMVQSGRMFYAVSIVVYSVVFIFYAAMRIRKALLRRKCSTRILLPIAAVICIAACALSCIPWNADADESVSDENIIQNDGNENRISDSENAADVNYADGTHFGIGEGYNGDVTVAVRISEGNITGVTVVATKDDDSFWKKAIVLIDDVIARQSADVDTVSGATYSSEGLKEAIANALAAAVIQK